jgi:hypothetical protein
LLKQPTIFGDRGKEPVGGPGRIAAMQRTDCPQCRGDGRHIAVAAELADEAAIGLERPRNPGDHGLGPVHPVKRRIGEDRVELGLEGKLAIDASYLETFGGGSGQKLLAHITPKDVSAGSGDFLGHCAIAAAKVENPLAALRRQQIESVVG